MHSYKNLMVALDFSGSDALLVEYVSFLSAHIKPVKINFVHFLHVPEMPDVLHTKREYMAARRLRQMMVETVTENFQDPNKFKMEYTVVEGHPLSEMLRWSASRNIDLLIMAKKAVNKGSGLLAERMARKAGCSILLVPEAARHTMKNILVASDFSDNSLHALKAGWKLAQKTAAKLLFYHTFHLPAGYYKSGKTANDFQTVMLEYASRDCSKSFKSAKIPPGKVSPILEMATKYGTSKMIHEAAHQRMVDLIIVGAKGRNAASSIFLGSVTEKLIRQNFDIPILVVKEKGKQFNFWDFLNAT